MRSAWVSDKRDSQSKKPGRPATVKSSTQEPIVTASVTIAAVAALSDIDAANNASAPTSSPNRKCPSRRLSVSGASRCPPTNIQAASAESTGTAAINQAASVAASLAAIRVEVRYGNWMRSRSAPVSFSCPSTRIATNGNSSVTAT